MAIIFASLYKVPTIYTKIMFIRITLIFLMVSIFSSAASAQSRIPNFAPKHYICYQSEAPLQIDGKLDEASWEKAPWTDEFIDIEGEHMPKPRFATRAKMLWDSEYLYIAADMEEPHVWGTLTERDAVIFYDNDFEVFIDPDGDSHFYYEFEMNALNTIWDLMLTAPYRDDRNVVLNSWDIRGIKTAVNVRGTLNNPEDEDQGWSVEIAMPWKVLKEKSATGKMPGNGEYWRINFSRVEWQTEVVDGNYKKKINPETNKSYPEDNWVWTAQSYINMHRPETWGFLVFDTAIVGEGDASFSIPESEYIKWELRKVYYRQNDYFREHGKYAHKVKELGMSESKYTIEMVAGETFYNATICQTGNICWQINEKGRVDRSK